MKPPRSFLRLGAWILLILINVFGAIPVFQPAGYLPVDPDRAMLVRPGPNQDPAKAAPIAIDSPAGGSPSPTGDRAFVFVHSRYRTLQQALICLSSLALIALILLSPLGGGSKPASPE